MQLQISRQLIRRAEEQQCQLKLITRWNLASKYLQRIESEYICVVRSSKIKNIAIIIVSSSSSSSLCCGMVRSFSFA